MLLVSAGSQTTQRIYDHTINHTTLNWTNPFGMTQPYLWRVGIIRSEVELREAIRSTRNFLLSMGLATFSTDPNDLPYKLVAVEQ